MRHHRIVTDSMLHEFRLLRNRLEAEVAAPAVLFITSATDRDGAGLTAYGLAESLSRTKQRTCLVTTDATIVAPENPHGELAATMQRRASDRLEATPGTDGRFSVVTISPERLATLSRSSIAGLVQSLRVDHEYVVVDGGDLPKSSFALLMVALADATLIAFRTGRSQQPADRVMLDTLERCETKVFGIVMTDEPAIEQFSHHGSPPVDAPVAVPKRASLISRGLEVAAARFGRSL